MAMSYEVDRKQKQAAERAKFPAAELHNVIDDGRYDCLRLAAGEERYLDMDVTADGETSEGRIWLAADLAALANFIRALTLRYNHIAAELNAVIAETPQLTTLKQGGEATCSP
jgi:hypothetical protein